MSVSSLIQILPGIPFATMIPVEGGTFWMGDDKGYEFWGEKPAHQVQLDSFFIGQYPVTQALWKAVMGKKSNPSFFKGDQRPVESISWIEIVEVFLPKLNDKTSKSRLAGYSYRLPTEAEWEFAARGGLKSRGFLYAGSDQLKNVGWFDGYSHGETKDVGQKQPNELGIYDMCGNAWEKCWDHLNEDYYEHCKIEGIAKNPKGPQIGTYLVVRGGNFASNINDCIVTRRFHFPSIPRDTRAGFRVVLSPIQLDSSQISWDPPDF